MIPSYVCEDMKFFNFIPSTVFKGAILIIFDVKNLYTLIPHNLYNKAVQIWMEKEREWLLHYFRQNSLSKLWKLFLK